MLKKNVEMLNMHQSKTNDLVMATVLIIIKLLVVRTKDRHKNGLDHDKSRVTPVIACDSGRERYRRPLTERLKFGFISHFVKRLLVSLPGSTSQILPSHVASSQSVASSPRLSFSVSGLLVR